MKTLIKPFLLAVLFCLSNTLLTAQDDKPQRYSAVDYMKVEPGMQEAYLELEQVWKKIHKANIDAGKYVHWTLIKVEYPFGAHEEYNYMTRVTFDGEKQLANYLDNWEMPDLKSLLTEKERALVKRTAEIRTFVKSEIWSLTDLVLAEDMDGADVHVFNFFDFPEGSGATAHNKVETEIWKPVHEARIKDGKMKGWVLLNMELPYGSAQPYHAATVDIYASTEQYLTAGSPMPYFEKVHPAKNMEQLWEDTRNTADLVRAELRRKIDDVGN